MPVGWINKWISPPKLRASILPLRTAFPGSTSSGHVPCVLARLSHCETDFSALQETLAYLALSSLGAPREWDLCSQTAFWPPQHSLWSTAGTPLAWKCKRANGHQPGNRHPPKASWARSVLCTQFQSITKPKAGKNLSLLCLK